MKLVTFSILLIVLSTTQAILPDGPTELIESMLMQAVNMSSQSKVMERLTKRATSSDFRRFPSFDAYLQCQNVASDAQCTSGLQQEVFSIAKDCGQDMLANVARYSCGINSDGTHCGLGIEIASTVSLSDVQSCFSSTSCTSTCRFRINSLRNQLGCCAGYLTETFRSDSNILSGNLWSRCGVSPGPLCEIPTFTSNVSQPMTCSLSEVNRQIIAQRCRPSSSEEIFDNLLNADGCGSLAQVHVEACTVADNGQFCSLKTDVSSFRGVAQNCAAHLSSSSCSSSCRSSLSTFRNVFGCCINSIFNGTLAAVHPSSSFRQILPYFSNSLWSRCNVASPGMCNSTLVLPAVPTRPSTPPTTNGPSTPPTTSTNGPSIPPGTTNGLSTPPTTPTSADDGKNGCVNNGGILSLVILLALTISLP